MQRHHIRIGDSTTAGGVVVCATSSLSILGRPVAVEGDTIDCPACKATGTIVCVGPRLAESIGGRKVALEGDLCSCRCPGPPKLLPSQGLCFQAVDGIGADSRPGQFSPQGSTFASAPASAMAPGFAAPAAAPDASWVAFRLDESASCEGLSCRLHFDDDSQTHVVWATGKRLAIHGTRARSVVRVDYLIDESEASPFGGSLTALLLERMQA